MSSLSGDSVPVFHWGIGPLSHCMQSWWDCQSAKAGNPEESHVDGKRWELGRAKWGVPKDPAPRLPETSLAAVLSGTPYSAFPSPCGLSHSVCALQSKNPRGEYSRHQTKNDPDPGGSREALGMET